MRVMFLSLLSATFTVAMAGKPNVVFILTDDQDTRLSYARGEGKDEYTDLGSLEVMPVVQRELMGKGARLTNYFVATPICCPSRTEFFSGRYFHNVHQGSGGCMHANTNYASSETSLFGQFAKGGYSVGLFGKTTNNQESYLPQILENKFADRIDAPQDISDYNGLGWYTADKGATKLEKEQLDQNNPLFNTTYQTDQILGRALRWLDRIEKNNLYPFFLYAGPHAPHYSAEPALAKQHIFDNVSAPITPNWNVSSPDKTQHIRQNPPISDNLKCYEDQHFRDRWECLLSVDDMVGALLEQLETVRQIDNTVVVYTSDHGYKLGQWRIPFSKQHPYETDIRIPFIIRGPGISAGVELPQVTGNVDLQPTLLELAGLNIPSTVDGKSFAHLLKGNKDSKWREQFLVQYVSVGTYFADHSKTFLPSGKQCPQPQSAHVHSGDRTPCKEGVAVGSGSCWFLDSQKSNTWTALRTINSTHDTTYVEYQHAGNTSFYEYYDIKADPYQLKNIYNSSPLEVQASLAAELASYMNCQGSSCI